MTDTDTDTWLRVRTLFDRAVERSGDQRAAFLDRACAGDEALRAAVDSLLEADGEAGEFMDDSVLPQSASEADRLIGTRLGTYRVIRRIGRGGMSTVYLAVQDGEAFERRVVIKLVRADRQDADLERRLRTERRILASLDHPNIARLFDGGTTEDRRPFFVMEYIEGLPIDNYADHNQLSIKQRLRLFRTVCSAVHYAHQNLIVHRDLKPSNILVTADGEPKLLDFGIAKLLNPELAGRELEATATWLRLMTPQYASPEQVRGKLVTTASDVYSLGVLLYKLLTGRLPYDFDRCSPGEIERILTEHDPPRPSTAVTRSQSSARETSGTDELARSRRLRPKELRRQLAGDLDSIVMRALRSAPQRRYASADRLADDIERFERGLPVEARGGGWRYRLGKLVHRHRAAAIAATLVVAVLAASAWALVAKHAQVRSERDQARQERAQRQTVIDLMIDILRVADPEISNGASFTVREALEASGPKLRRRLGDQPALHAELLHTSGTIYYNLGLWNRARIDLESALSVRRGLYGDHHPAIAPTLSQLGLVLGEIGEEAPARAMTAEAVDLLRSEDVSPAPELLSALNNQVTVLCYYHDYEAAEQPATEAVSLGRALRADPQHLARALYNRGTVHVRRSEPEKAVPLFEQSLELTTMVHGDEHLALTAPLNNIGSAKRRSGDLEGAEAAFERTLALQRQILGEHPALVPTLNNLASVRRDQGRLDDAEALFEEALRLLQREAAEGKPELFKLELQLAEVGLRQGNAAKVLGRLDDILPAWRRRLGDDPSLATADWLRGRALAALGRTAEAEAAWTQSFDQAVDLGASSAARRALDSLRQPLEATGQTDRIAELEARLAN